jgi:hypothetical protein
MQKEAEKGANTMKKKLAKQVCTTSVKRDLL